jgi:uncharacterized protein YllA (UPF0747 family)
LRTGILNTHETEIANWLVPNNALQERSFGLLQFLSSEGSEMIGRLDGCIETGSGDHCVLMLSPSAK